MKRGSGFAFRRFVCGFLAACYGILSVIATAPHLHDRFPLNAGRSECRGAVTPGFEAASAKPPADQVINGACRLCGWSRSSAGLSPVSVPCAAAVSTDTARCDIGVQVTDALPAGNVLLRAPPAV